MISLSLSVSMPRSQSTLSIRVVPGMGILLNPLDEEVTLACSDERVIKGRVLDVFPNVRSQPSPSILALFEPIFAPFANFGLVLRLDSKEDRFASLDDTGGSFDSIVVVQPRALFENILWLPPYGIKQKPVYVLRCRVDGAGMVYPREAICGAGIGLDQQN